MKSIFELLIGLTAFAFMAVVVYSQLKGQRIKDTWQELKGLLKQDE